MEQKQQMHDQRLGQRLAVAVALSLMLLIVGVIGLGVAIRHGDVVPPDLDVSLSGVRIVAYVTRPIECQPDLICPGTPRDYRVVWVLARPPTDYVHETWHPILSMPLQR